MSQRISRECPIRLMKARFVDEMVPLMRSPAQLIFCLLLTTTGGCGPADRSATKGTQPRLVLLYATCTLGNHFLSPYNPNVKYTPNLERFATRATVFEKHRTEAGLSGVAFASIFTGTQAVHHGIFTHPAPLSDDLYDISEAFSDNGYETYWWNKHAMCNKSLNYGQGVTESRHFNGMLGAEHPELAKVLERLSTNKTKKAFLLTNFTVTHGPYRLDALEGFSRRFPEECRILDELAPGEFDKYYNLYRRQYHPLRYDFPNARKLLKLTDQDIRKLSDVLELVFKSNIWKLDRLFGNLIARIKRAGMMNDALIIFTSDHGETLYREHAPFKWCHGTALQSDVLNVPLIIQTPDPAIRPGRYSQVTRSTDVFPTVAALAELSLPKKVAWTGLDLSGVLKGQAEPPSLLAYSHSSMVSPAFRVKDVGAYRLSFYPDRDMSLTWVAVRDKDTVVKYKNQGEGRFDFEAYDLRADQAEAHNLYDPTNEHHRELADQLKQYKATLVDAYHLWLEQGNSENIDEEDTRKRLKSLGYIN